MIGMDRRQFLVSGAVQAGLFLAPGMLSAGGVRGFSHGVASGDPRQDSMVLWTRYLSPDPVNLRVEVAEDEAFGRIVARGEAFASPATDCVAKIRATGLEAGRRYFYRFTAPGGERSETGRTQTLPVGRVDRFRVAVFSCANATSGWFNAYAHAAARNDIDLVLHLGDYIYESPLDRPDAVEMLAERRSLAPSHETLSLIDYRLRYASYRADPDLAALHRAFPMVAVPDDHESANNAWSGGASGHQPDEGSWEVRKAAAVRAWAEWLPMGEGAYGHYEIGDLASLYRLETRLTGRDRQLDIEPVIAGSRDIPKAVAAFKARDLADPHRTMMGAAQEKWLYDGFRRSGGQKAWQILAQQVIMGPMMLPETMTQWFADPATLDAEARQELEIAAMLGRADVPARFDRWDGYPAARNRLLGAAQAAGANLITLSGDSHNAWAYNLSANGKPAGVEFAGQSVSSFGMERRFTADSTRIAADLLARNPELKWCDTQHRGYMTIDITPDAVEAEWLFLPSNTVRSTAPTGRKTLAVSKGQRLLTD